MDTAARFRRMFQGAELGADDLLLLESFQIALLPGWVPEQELGVVLAARPEIARYFVARCPEIADFVRSVLRMQTKDPSLEDVAAASDTVVWTIADLLDLGAVALDGPAELLCRCSSALPTIP